MRKIVILFLLLSFITHGQEPPCMFKIEFSDPQDEIKFLKTYEVQTSISDLVPKPLWHNDVEPDSSYRAFIDAPQIKMGETAVLHIMNKDTAQKMILLFKFSETTGLTTKIQISDFKFREGYFFYGSDHLKKISTSMYICDMLNVKQYRISRNKAQKEVGI